MRIVICATIASTHFLAQSLRAIIIVIIIPAAAAATTSAGPSKRV
jgi:hypothetical protein